MLRLRDVILADVFRQAKGAAWTGRVFSTARNHEYVPFFINGSQKFIMEFNVPHFLTQTNFHEDTLIPANKGSFVPKLDHRRVNVFHVADNGKLVNLCIVASHVIADAAPGGAAQPGEQAAVKPGNAQHLVSCLRNAVITFYRSAPHANQFFFRTDARTRELLLSAITDFPKELVQKYTFERHDDLQEPFVGFSIVSNAL